MADINVKVSFGATAESAQSTAEEALNYGQQTLLPLINANKTNIATNRDNIAVLNEITQIQDKLTKIKLLFEGRQLYVVMPFNADENSKMTFNFSLLRSTNGVVRYKLRDDTTIHFRRGKWTQVNPPGHEITLEATAVSSNRYIIREKQRSKSKAYYDYPGTYRAPQNLGEDFECVNAMARVNLFQGEYIDGWYTNKGDNDGGFRHYTFFQKIDDGVSTSVWRKFKNVKLGLKTTIAYTASDGTKWTFEAPILPFAVNRWYVPVFKDNNRAGYYVVPLFSVGRWAY